MINSETVPLILSLPGALMDRVLYLLINTLFKPVDVSMIHYYRANLRNKEHPHCFKLNLSTMELIHEVCSRCGLGIEASSKLANDPFSRDHFRCIDPACTTIYCWLCWRYFEENDLISRNAISTCTYLCDKSGKPVAFHQKFFSCLDCDLEVCCWDCAKNCHIGHKLSQLKFQTGYCDCGPSGKCHFKKST